MTEEELDLALRAAEVSVSHAQDVRSTYRKRTGRGDKARQADIQQALNRLRRVMRPIRAEIARLPYEIRETDDAVAVAALNSNRQRLLAASDAMQRERRKLWKMKERKIKMKERKITHGKR